MISDEMRELLSAYVDEELRDSDAARVEDLIKRDPALRREVDSYRALRGRLRAWDEAEHGEPPSPDLKARALRRAQVLVGAQRAAGRGRIPRILLHPAVAAAGLLLAAGLGFLLADSAVPEGPRVEAPRAQLPSEPVRPLPDYALEESVVQFDLGPAPSADAGGTPLAELLRRNAKGYLVDGAVLRPGAMQLLHEWRTEDRRWERLRRHRIAHPVESTTGTRNPVVFAMLGGYDVSRAPLRSLVLVKHPVYGTPPEVRAVPAGSAAAGDYQASGGEVLLETSRLGRGAPVLVLAGEILRADRDRSRRTRIVGASSWVEDSQLVPVVWADTIDLPRNSSYLELQPFTLGPRARQRIVSAGGRDRGFLEWLRENYPAGGLRRSFEDKGGRRAKAVGRLTQELARDGAATGFAVIADGKVLGVELFASHELMLAFAPRLLHGYMVEAGTNALALEPPRASDGTALELARALIDDVPERVARLEDDARGTQERWPEGLRRVQLKEPLGRVVGHGLLYEGRPLYLFLSGASDRP
jgi:hypothetical protein